MPDRTMRTTCMMWGVFCILLCAGIAGNARAHCDAENGPVAVDARKALDENDFVAAARWVGEKQEDELRAAFEQALAVYRDAGSSKEMGGKAADLAERYFMETAVRLHRQAEGFPYTGLKPAEPLLGDIAAAERALESGQLNPVMDMLTSEMAKKLQHLFTEVRRAAKIQDENLAAGREYADAYVRYVIYVHGLYKTIKAGPAHGVGE